jgi:hypothetical protein
MAALENRTCVVTVAKSEGSSITYCPLKRIRARADTFISAIKGKAWWLLKRCESGSDKVASNVGRRKRELNGRLEKEIAQLN